jgi:fatty-acyl-CoA synthase
MKLSYFTGNWPGLSWNEHCDLAESMGFQGLELAYSAADAQKILDASRQAERHQILRRLSDNRLIVPCVTVSISSEEAARNAALKDAADCILFASALRSPYVCLDIMQGDKDTEDQTITIIGELLPLAETEGIILLIETKGIYADSLKLCKLWTVCLR